MSGGVCLLQMNITMSIYISSWKIGMRHRLLWMVWNGDMEMTCEGARRGLQKRFGLRLARLLLLFLLHLPLLVEDLLGLSVADEEDDGGEDEDDRAPGAAVPKAKGVGASSSWLGKIVQQSCSVEMEFNAVTANHNFSPVEPLQASVKLIQGSRGTSTSLSRGSLCTLPTLKVLTVGNAVIIIIVVLGVRNAIAVIIPILRVRDSVII